MFRDRIARHPNLPLAIAASFAVLTFVQLLWPLGSIALKRHPAAASSHSSSYRHTVEDVSTSSGPGAATYAGGLHQIEYTAVLTRLAASSRRTDFIPSAWPELGRVLVRKIPRAPSSPGH
ncbi:MAG TPA: hypothetical protein VMV27_13060 [Candidatus Binataceae bacterium]|nr:hypothetical protein [Candidatus Binataceae bacterium]